MVGYPTGTTKEPANCAHLLPDTEDLAYAHKYECLLDEAMG